MRRRWGAKNTPAFVVYPGLVAKVDDTVCGVFKSGECAQNRSFTRARWTEEDGNQWWIEIDL
jgi:hypothetical protein